MKYVYRNTSQDWLIQLLKNKKIRHKFFISLSSEEDSGGNDHYGNVRITFDRNEIFKQGAIEIFYDNEFFEDYPKICQHVTGFKNANEYYENRGYSGPEDANDNLDLTWEQYIEDYQDEAEIVIQQIKYTENLIKNVQIFEEYIEPELKDMLIKLNIPFEINEKITHNHHIITTIKEWKRLNENINNYMLGKVKYSWIKNQIKNIFRIEPKDTTRLDILSERKKELHLDEFQTLYDYWNFCDKNSSNFKLANNPIENYKRVIKEWTWYLVMIQLFQYELKNAKRDFYNVQYNEIKSLPKLTGELEKDKIIFENAVRNFFMKPDSITRQSIISYDIYFKSLF